MDVDISAVILAAGKGTRFDPTGALFKLLQPLPNGQLVIQAVCETMLASVDNVTVVCGARKNEIEAAISALPVNIVHCREADTGMGASIRSGVSVNSPRQGWLLMLGDMPYLSHSTIERVLEQLRAGALIARPFFQDRPGHPVAFSPVLGPELRECDPGTGLRELIKRHTAQMVRIDVDDWGCVHDVDTPADLIYPPQRDGCTSGQLA